MKPALVPFVALALIPAMSGSLVAADRTAVTLALCGGGAVSVPTGPVQVPGGENAPCCAKGCHSGPSRKRHAAAA